MSMLPKPHGGRLANRIVTATEGNTLARKANRLPCLELSDELAHEAMNIATGVFSPLEGFLGQEDCESVVTRGRLASGLPWTIPIVLSVSAEQARRLGGEIALAQRRKPFAILEVQEIYCLDKDHYARGVFGTVDPRHPGVAWLRECGDTFLGGRVTVFRSIESTFPRYYLRPLETRVLFDAKGWKSVVGFQTRNVPHLGHEYVQKTALTFVDGIFINPVIGRKKLGDFEDAVILRAYEVLLRNYYLRERVVLAVLPTGMRYAGPREAIFHAVVRKNFGCTHFIVGRDHAGVGNFYPPYAAQEIFDEYPDLGIVPLFFTAFFYCRRCGGVANEKTCPHQEAERVPFSGTLLRRASTEESSELGHLVRPDVAAVIREFANPFVTSGV